MAKQHRYQLRLTWTGNNGTGTSHYRAYERSHVIQVENKPEIRGSADPMFRGDHTKHNPEDLLIASLSACHMLMYLHLCAEAGVVVAAYEDEATGVLELTPDGGGHFAEVTLHPRVTVTAASMVESANQLHKKANELCFIANSVNFPVHHQPTSAVG